jgi:hypothetical protein
LFRNETSYLKRLGIGVIINDEELAAEGFNLIKVICSPTTFQEEEKKLVLHISEMGREAALLFEHEDGSRFWIMVGVFSRILLRAGIFPDDDDCENRLTHMLKEPLTTHLWLPKTQVPIPPSRYAPKPQNTSPPLFEYREDDRYHYIEEDYVVSNQQAGMSNWQLNGWAPFVSIPSKPGHLGKHFGATITYNVVTKSARCAYETTLKIKTIPDSGNPFQDPIGPPPGLIEQRAAEPPNLGPSNWIPGPASHPAHAMTFSSEEDWASEDTPNDSSRLKANFTRLGHRLKVSMGRRQ